MEMYIELSYSGEARYNIIVECVLGNYLKSQIKILHSLRQSPPRSIRFRRRGPSDSYHNLKSSVYVGHIFPHAASNGIATVAASFGSWKILSNVSFEGRYFPIIM